MLALVLQRFAFVVAPEYVYAPTDFLALQPTGFPRCAETLGPGPFASECLSHPKAAVRGGKGAADNAHVLFDRIPPTSYAMTSPAAQSVVAVLGDSGGMVSKKYDNV